MTNSARGGKNLSLIQPKSDVVTYFLILIVFKGFKEYIIID